MMANRSGKSLIEMVVVMSVMSMVMLISVRTITLLMRADASGGKSLVAGTSLSRLAHQFRLDVHAAWDAQLVTPEESGEARLQLSLPESTIVEYRPFAEKILRTIRRGEKTTSREDFHLLRGENRFEISEDKIQIISLVHVRNTAKSYEKSPVHEGEKEIRIEATRGRNHRYTKREN
jgi:type II secretory pathway pseudopilin PulG